MARSFNFSTEYTLRGDVVRYLGDSVFKQFESVKTKALYILTDDELSEVKETSLTVQGNVDGYLVPQVDQNQYQVVSKPDPRPVSETQTYDIGYKPTVETVAEPKPVAGSPASAEAPEGTLAASPKATKASK